MAQINLTDNTTFIALPVTTGTVQNISPQAKIEIASSQTANTGIILEPGEMRTFDNTQLYVRAVLETGAIVRCENFIEAGGGGDSDADLWRQVTVTGITASSGSPYDVSCSLGGTSEDLCLPAPCVLKYSAGTTTLTTLCAFNTGDAADYAYNTNYVQFTGGYMKLKTSYVYNMTVPTAFDDGYLSTVELDLTQFKSVASYTVANV